MSRVVASGVGYTIDGEDLVGSVDLTVAVGSLVAVVGPNGAGKTTLVRLLSGEITPTRGSVSIGGLDPHRADPMDLALVRAVLPQQTFLHFAFRCLDVVMMGRHPHGDGGAEAKALEAMTVTDTTQFASRSYPTLSGGEQTRVSLARVLAQDTPVLFLDEPTGSLDLSHQELIMATLSGLARSGSTVIAVLHDLNLATRYADRVLLMDRGRVVADGAPVEVLTVAAVGAVYRVPVEIVIHPSLGYPVILPSDAGAGG
jgi:iron complex transport system ATP-binding protein